MRPHRHLDRLQISACRRLTRLRSLVSGQILEPPTIARETQISFCVIEILNTWSNFARSYYLSCILSPRLYRGIRVTTSTPVRDFSDAIGLAIRVLRPNTPLPPSGLWHRRDEPAWHDHHNLLRFCGNLGCSNYPDIQAALSMGSRVFLDLPVFRNFYAHRNQMSQEAVQQIAPQYGIPATLRPSMILSNVPIGRSQPLILGMVDDLTVTIELLCY
jgi:hypothetical protein